MCIQDNVAEFAGTMDSTAAAAAAVVVVAAAAVAAAAVVVAWLQSQSLLAGTDQPEMTNSLAI